MSMTDTYTIGTELAKTLFKATYTHRGIISAGSYAQFSRLLGETQTPLESVISEIGLLPDRRIDGAVHVDYEGHEMPSYLLIRAVMNMIMVYIIKSFNFLRIGVLSDARAYGTYSMDRVLRAGEQVRLQHRIERALALLEPMKYCDLRWNFVLHSHLYTLRDKVQDLTKCLDKSDPMRRDIVVKLQTFIEPWCGHKPRPRPPT